LFVVMSFVSFLHSIVKFASLIKASCICIVLYRVSVRYNQL
jgi:hypothetical protein